MKTRDEIKLMLKTASILADQAADMLRAYNGQFEARLRAGKAASILEAAWKELGELRDVQPS